MKKISFVLCLTVLLLGVGNQVLLCQYASEDAQAKLILKILPYDRNFNRFGDTVKIGVSSKHMLKALKDQKKTSLRGKKLEVGLMESLEDIPAYGIVFIDRNWSANYDAAKTIAVEKKILMFCGSYQAVEKGNAAIAFRIIQRKMKIVLNLGITKEMGTDFPSNLLKLSMLVGNL